MDLTNHYKHQRVLSNHLFSTEENALGPLTLRCKTLLHLDASQYFPSMCFLILRGEVNPEVIQSR